DDGSRHAGPERDGVLITDHGTLERGIANVRDAKYTQGIRVAVVDGIRRRSHGTNESHPRSQDVRLRLPISVGAMRAEERRSVKQPLSAQFSQFDDAVLPARPAHAIDGRTDRDQV